MKIVVTPRGFAKCGLENAKKISELELSSVSANSSIQEISARADNIEEARKIAKEYT